VNGLHAVVVAPVLVRVEMLRTGRTYELLIFHGRLELDLAGKDKDKDKAGTVLPTFYSRAGEEVRIPKRFRPVVRAIVGAVHCNGCFHCHYVRPPQKEEEQTCAAESVTALHG
jgi:hypothetical protein